MRLSFLILFCLSSLVFSEDSAEKILSRYVPVKAQENEISKLIQGLGADHFRKRREAQQRLINIGVPALKAVEKASLSDDPEIKARALKVLSVIKGSDRLKGLNKILLDLTKEKKKAPLSIVFKLLPLTKENPYLIYTIKNYMKVCLSDNDKEYLISVLKSGEEQEKIIVLELYRNLEITKIVPILNKLLSSKSNKLKFNAAALFLAHTDNRGLLPLVELIKSEDQGIAGYSEFLLKKATGFKPVKDKDAELTIESKIAQWTKWIKANENVLLKKVDFNQAVNLVGTRWYFKSSTEVDLKPCSMIFKEDGILIDEERPNNKTHRWKLENGVLTITLNNKYATYTSIVVTSGYMEGRTINVRKTKWIWKAKIYPQGAPVPNIPDFTYNDKKK